MDEVLAAAGVALSLLVALVGAIWFLVATLRRERRRRTPTDHVFRGQGEAVMVAELLEEAAERGEAVRLNWPNESVDEVGRVRPYVQDEFPTAILPKIQDANERFNQGW